ncbi:MAG: GTPase HflX [Bacteroidota bacterium]|jgi:GTP-binding protein HflX
MINHLQTFEKNLGIEKCVLVAVIHENQTEEQAYEYLDELTFLADTAGAVCVKRFTQRMAKLDSNTFIGSGKLEQIRLYTEANDIGLIIFDDELSGRQQTNIEAAVKCKVVDRTGLILDIFASRARTAHAKTQVELAQLQYLLPRLKGLWSHLERQKGGIGMRGPGEKEIETDRRLVKENISKLKQDLSIIDRQFTTQRKSRGEVIRVALVGYTNVGKSTTMNLLSKSEVFAENKLFATLDTTVRKVVIDRIPFLLSDTVGFIRKLPHTLVESFKSTLDEVRESDILIHVVDISHPKFEDQMQTVNETLQELKVAEKPTLVVFNKMDLYTEKNFDNLTPKKIQEEVLAELENTWKTRLNGNCVFVSALQKQNYDGLRNTILEKVKTLYEIRYPFIAQKF